MTKLTLQLGKNAFDALLFGHSYTVQPVEDGFTQNFNLKQGSLDPRDGEYSITLYLTDNELSRINNCETVTKEVGIDGIDFVDVEADAAYAELIRKQSERN